MPTEWYGTASAGACHCPHCLHRPQVAALRCRQGGGRHQPLARRGGWLEGWVGVRVCVPGSVDMVCTCEYATAHWSFSCMGFGTSSMLSFLVDGGGVGQVEVRRGGVVCLRATIGDDGPWSTELWQTAGHQAGHSPCPGCRRVVALRLSVCPPSACSHRGSLWRRAILGKRFEVGAERAPPLVWQTNQAGAAIRCRSEGGQFGQALRRPAVDDVVGPAFGQSWHCMYLKGNSPRQSARGHGGSGSTRPA